ncbi:hypothetical protein [Kribbella sp. NPDC004875]|uniref:DUF7144 family membrane protein n=1 Tax=Kribbella sp. NPDC004875 TaxID=3364107 RepID=UPI0036C9854E
MAYSPDVDRADSRVDVPAETEVTAWTGWIAFGAMMMVMLGAFHAFQGLVALLDDGYYLVSKNGLAVHVNYTGWGWIHLILGGIIVLAGLGLLAGQLWARIVAVAAALVSAVVNVAFLAAYPVWSALMVFLDVIVIWAVIVHGREMKTRAGAV